MTVVGTRVLKAHKDAAKVALRENLPAFMQGDIDGDALATRVAEAVVTATDSTKTYYCVGVRLPSGTPMIYGPLATVTAAKRVIARGDVPGGEGTQVGIFPLYVPGTIEKKKPRK